MTEPKRNRTPINPQDPQDAHGVNYGGLTECTCWDAGVSVKRRDGAPLPKLHSLTNGTKRILIDPHADQWAHVPLTRWRVSDGFTAGPWCDTAYDCIASWNSDTHLEAL